MSLTKTDDREPLPLVIGARVGPYEVTAQIGVGGMGEVYRATDTNLKRAVAIKVLPASLAGDPERLARFQREAEVLAALNHPNIATIYGLERSSGMTALVMELVEGPTLAELIAQHAPPEAESLRSRPRDTEAVSSRGGGAPRGLEIDEALPIAKQIAEALEAAHEQGIIHRDLKPANIKLKVRGAPPPRTEDGPLERRLSAADVADCTVKVLDFGLAKAMEPTGVMAASNSMSPTITTPAMTQAGVILGTAAYMSPEQARGGTIDKRADLWAFGVVLFEVLTGKRLFDGATVSDTLAFVLTKEPDWTALPAMTPAPIRRLLRRCLQKDRKRRLDSAADARLEIEEALTAPAAENTQATAPLSTASSRLLWIALAAAVLVAAALALPAVRYLRETPPPSPPEMRTEISTPSTDRPTDFALSPDGRQIVFVASGDGASRLWLRSLATTAAQPLAGTEGATFPFWSPDSRSIGFFAGSALKRLDLGGGAPQTLAPVPTGRGGTWNPDGVIVFAPSLGTTLMRVSATGGPAVVVTTLGPRQTDHFEPYFLSDGRRFLFSVRGAADTAGIYLGTLEGSSTPTRLTSANSTGVSLPSGWLLWVRTGTLVAQRLDVAKAVLTGEPVTLADGVNAVSAAAGLVAYRTSGGSQRQLTWVDRSGTARGTVGDPDTTLGYPRVSPDGQRVAVRRNQDVWLLDGARTSRFTVDTANDSWPVWSPDSSRIVFNSDRTGRGDLYQKPTNGSGVEERLMASDMSALPTSWSADGRFLLYHSDDDLWVVPMVGDHTPSVFLKTPFREAFGAFSPDSRWVAYQSNESGRPEIYVRPFIPPGEAGTAPSTADGQWLVSTAGGIIPVWRPDGKELYYLNPAGAMMAVPITVTGATLAPGTPVVLFPTRIVGGGADVQVGWNYDVAPDGRFLINMELDSAAAPITLLQNWHPEATR